MAKKPSIVTVEEKHDNFQRLALGHNPRRT